MQTTIVTMRKFFFIITFCTIASTFLVLTRTSKTFNIATNIINFKYYDKFERFVFKVFSNTRSKTSKYVLSYTLFGKDSWQRYGKNVKNVAEEASKSLLYGSWTVRLYHDNYPKELQEKLTLEYRNLEFVDVRDLTVLKLNLVNECVTNINNTNAMTWRFLPIGDLSVNVTCSRDLDSPISKREEAAVKDWLYSGKIMHVMRDNPAHDVVILGGMWCFRNSKDRFKGQTILKLLLDKAQRRHFPSEAPKGDDQTMLARHMWPAVKSDVMQHDSYLCNKYHGSIPFPERRNGSVFVGCVRPCTRSLKCPVVCRPKKHQDWDFC